MKVFHILNDAHSQDILRIVIEQGGNDSCAIKRVRREKFLFISNGKFTVWNYFLLRFFNIPYTVVKDVPSNVNWLSRNFYLHAVGELSYPTKATEIEKLVRTMLVSSARKKMAKDKHGTK